MLILPQTHNICLYVFARRLEGRYKHNRPLVDHPGNTGHSHYASMGKLDPEAIDDLAKYPFNLNLPSFYVDANRCGARLSADAERLFAPKKDSQLWALKFDPIIGKGEPQNVQLIRLKGSTQLTTFLNTIGPTAVFSIRQSFSWSRLQISEEDLRQLFANQEVHPNFLDIVHIFGEKTEPIDESFSTFFCHPISRTVNLDSFSANDGYEIGYNIKYVAGHGRAFLKDPYSIRDTGVYHKYRRDSTTGECCSWILIHASDALEERFRNSFQISKETRCVLQFQIHAMVLLSVSENWRGYINYLEESFRKLRERGFLTNIKGPTGEGDIETDFSDIRNLQMLADKLHQLCHILGLNVQVGVHLKECIHRIRQRTKPDSSLATSFDMFDSQVELFLFQQRTHSARITCLISRAHGVSSLVQNIHEVRQADNSNRLNHAVRDITEQSIQENKLIKQLTHQSTLDTRSTMVIALISAIFLPATFAATLFGSNFFGFVSRGDHYMLLVAENIWIYLVTAVGLSSLTIFSWFWWWKSTRFANKGLREFDSEVLLYKQE